MKEEVHAPPGRGTDVLRSAGNEGEEAEFVAEGELLMAVKVLTRCSRGEEGRGRGRGRRLSWNGNACSQVRSLVKSL
jgi:hypothetical protein